MTPVARYVFSAFGIGLLFYFSALANDKIRPVSKPVQVESPEHSYESITLADFLFLRRGNNAVSVDLRKDAHFHYARIPDSINIADAESFRALPAEELEKLKSANHVILYDVSNQSSSLEAVAAILKNAGIGNLKIYAGGYAEWKACGLPLEGTGIEK